MNSILHFRSKSVYTKKIKKLITKNGYSDDDALVINLDEMKAGDTVLAHLYKLTGTCVVHIGLNHPIY